MHRVVDPSNPPRDIKKALRLVRAESFCNYNYNYARCLAAVYVSYTIKRDGVIYTTAVPSMDGIASLKEVYYWVVLDWHDRRCSVEML